jgi:hypothetical protein
VQVGLDIMNAKERPRSRANSDEFFKVFRKQLSHQEWVSKASCLTSPILITLRPLELQVRAVG